MNGRGGGAGAVGLQALDNTVYDHDILAVGGAEADGFGNPEFLAAVVYSVVEALAGSDEGIAVAKALKEDQLSSMAFAAKILPSTSGSPPPKRPSMTAFQSILLKFMFGCRRPT